MISQKISKPYFLIKLNLQAFVNFDIIFLMVAFLSAGYIFFNLSSNTKTEAPFHRFFPPRKLSTLSKNVGKNRYEEKCYLNRKLKLTSHKKISKVLKF